MNVLSGAFFKALWESYCISESSATALFLTLLLSLVGASLRNEGCEKGSLKANRFPDVGYGRCQGMQNLFNHIPRTPEVHYKCTKGTLNMRTRYCPLPGIYNKGPFVVFQIEPGKLDRKGWHGRRTGHSY